MVTSIKFMICMDFHTWHIQASHVWGYHDCSVRTSTGSKASWEPHLVRRAGGRHGVMLPEAACDLPGSSTQTFPSPISASTEEEQIICLQTKILTGVWQLWRIGNICIRCTGKFPLRLRAVRRCWGATPALESWNKKETMDPFRRQSLICFANKNE